MFKNFAWYTGDWSIVLGDDSMILFVDRDYMCFQPKGEFRNLLISGI